MAGKVSTTEQDFTNLRGFFSTVSQVLVWRNIASLMGVARQYRGPQLVCEL